MSAVPPQIMIDPLEQPTKWVAGTPLQPPGSEYNLTNTSLLDVYTDDSIKKKIQKEKIHRNKQNKQNKKHKKHKHVHLTHKIGHGSHSYDSSEPQTKTVESSTQEYTNLSFKKPHIKNNGKETNLHGSLNRFHNRRYSVSTYFNINSLLRFLAT
eukprot:TRINITY_DN2602_c0_g3_i2.p1 TRINITY_DN2602_c0_g3~~TRINITY_DN2602_c0_g3_i2.p1  ORF type:complete len:154 (-),score=6.55 TRINITY_DN2602_c0_g3_i2:348-809(-)